MSDAPLAFLDDPLLPWTALDRAFVRTLHALVPVVDPRHAWLAALASQQFGLGHACIELDPGAEGAPELPGWEPEARARVPGDLAAAITTMPWAGEGTSPLVVAQRDSGCSRLYLRRAWSAEQRILGRLSALMARPAAVPETLASALDELFGGAVAVGSEGQRRACEVAAQGRFTIVTGGPGTGKTTTVARLLAWMLREAALEGRELRIALAAPTGKAAARLGQSLASSRAALPADVRGLMPTTASTVHKLLGIRAGSAPRALPPLAADVVIVDEASMVDLELMASLLEAVPDAARLVLLGDRDQLASVEAGAVLAQLCDNPWLADRVATLRYSHRFDSGGGIGRWASLVNLGDGDGVLDEFEACPAWGGAAPGKAEAAVVQRLSARDAGDWVACLREGWREWLAGLAAVSAAGRLCDDAQALRLLDDFGAFQVLCALRRGPWGVEAMNPLIARSLGFPREPWYPGRPVMITRNDHALGLMNGDVGLCLRREEGLRVAFRDSDGNLRWFSPARLESVETVFAMTVHKSQGSEFRHVLLVLPDRPSAVLTRELVYTGLTRARERLTLLAPERLVLREAVRARVLRRGGLADSQPPPRAL